MKLWQVAHFFHSLLVRFVNWKEKRQLCIFSFQITNLTKSEWKKRATGQNFIRKEITTYRIGTLTNFQETQYEWNYFLSPRWELQDPNNTSSLDNYMELDFEWKESSRSNYKHYHHEVWMIIDILCSMGIKKTVT